MKQFIIAFDAPEMGHRRRTPCALCCIYCGKAASTRDHVPPKVLLQKPRPLNLRTVPACTICNTGWSLDEEYFAVVLAHVGHQPHLTTQLENGGTIDRALSASPGLDENIIKALFVGEDGRVWFRPDLTRIGNITTKIAYGLFCLKYGQGRALRDFSSHWISGLDREIPQHLVAAQWRWPGIRRKRWTIVQRNVFSFLFAKGWMGYDPPLYCFLEFHQTIFAAVCCPPPIGSRISQRLRSKPWV